MDFTYTAAGERCRVLLEHSALTHLGQALSSTRAMIVTDGNVAPLYLARAEQSLRLADIEAVSFVLPAGEQAKSFENYGKLLCALSVHRLCRSDSVIALGGGVVGDLAGFAAATYLRGLHFVQVPTSLLAMVDAGIGGKCAVNLPAGKNLAGAFHQPVLTLCDTALLDTLPRPLFCEGCAEIIKTAVLFDEALFAHLEEHGLNFDREWVLARCLRHKARLVEADPFDHAERRLLNLGHTLAHAVEVCSNFTVLHGNAVAIGLAAMSRAFCADSARILRLLQAFSLPVSTDFSAQQLAEAALSDKKRNGASIALVVPRRIGHCEIVDYPTKQLVSLWQEVLK